MQELLRTVWQGWLDYTESGKFAALLLLALLYLWFRRERCREWLLLVYTTIVTVCCICPVTAAVFMKYQTQFYDYRWIWCSVPMTILIAYAATVFLQEYKKLAVALLLVALLCGRMGEQLQGTRTEHSVRENVGRVLELLEEEAKGDEVLLWAPGEVMELARGQRPGICLIYGRDMWEAALGAYSYDSYSETRQLMYLWMSNAQEAGSMLYAAASGVVYDGAWMLETARTQGIDVLLLPESIPIEELQPLCKENGLSVKQQQGYYVLWL